MSTAIVAPPQTEMTWVFDSPEGRDYAPPGYQCTDIRTGNIYAKTTDVTLNTGWKQIQVGTSSDLVKVTNADPVADPGLPVQIVFNKVDGNLWIWDGTQWWPLIA